MGSGSATSAAAKTKQMPVDELPSSASVWDVAYSPDGNYLLTAHYDGSALLWRLRTEGHDDPVPLKAHDKSVRRCVFSPNGKRIVLGSSDGTFTIWDTETRELLRKIEAHEHELKGLVFTNDGSKIMTGAMHEPNVKIWDAESGTLLSEFAAHDQHVSRVVISKDGQLLATSGAKDGVCTVWEVGSWKKRFSVTASFDDLSALAFSPDSSMIATGGSEGTVRLWDCASGKQIRTFSVSDPVWEIVFVPTGQRLVVSDMGGLIRTWDVSTGALHQEFVAHWAGITGMTVSPDGLRLATCSWEATTRIWDLAAIPQTAQAQGPQPEAVFAGFRGTPGASVAFSPTDDILVAADVWQHYRWLDAAAFRPLGKPSRMMEEGWLCLGSVRFAPDGKTVVACPQTKEVHFYDAASFQLRETMNPTGAPSICEFCPDGTSVVVCHWSKGLIEKWDTATGDRKWVVVSKDGKPDFPRISPDGSTVAVDTSTGRVLLLDLETGKPLREPLVHGGDKLLTLEFSPDGAMLVTGGADKRLRLWDTSDFRQTAELGGHVGQIISAAFSTDGRWLVTSDVEDWMDCWNSQRVATCGQDYHLGRAGKETAR